MEADDGDELLVTSAKRIRTAAHKDCTVPGCSETYPFRERNHVELHVERERKAAVAAAVAAAHTKRRAAVDAAMCPASDCDDDHTVRDYEAVFSEWLELRSNSIVVPQQPLPQSALAERHHAFDDALNGFRPVDESISASADAIMDGPFDADCPRFSMDDDEPEAALEVVMTTMRVPVRHHHDSPSVLLLLHHYRDNL
jgi:hypothetical protein